MHEENKTYVENCVRNVRFCYEYLNGPQKCLFFYMQKVTLFIYFWFWDYNVFMVGFETFTQRSDQTTLFFLLCSRPYLVVFSIQYDWYSYWDPENIETSLLSSHLLWRDVIISSQGEFACKICLFGYQRLAVRPARFEFVAREPVWLM